MIGNIIVISLYTHGTSLLKFLLSKHRSLILVSMATLHKVILTGFCLTESKVSFYACCSYCRILPVCLLHWYLIKPIHVCFLEIRFIATKVNTSYFLPDYPSSPYFFPLLPHAHSWNMPPRATLTLRSLPLNQG